MQKCKWYGIKIKPRPSSHGEVHVVGLQGSTAKRHKKVGGLGKNNRLPPVKTKCVQRSVTRWFLMWTKNFFQLFFFRHNVTIACYIIIVVGYRRVLINYKTV